MDQHRPVLLWVPHDKTTKAEKQMHHEKHFTCKHVLHHFAGWSQKLKTTHPYSQGTTRVNYNTEGRKKKPSGTGPTGMLGILKSQLHKENYSHI